MTPGDKKVPTVSSPEQYTLANEVQVYQSYDSSTEKLTDETDTITFTRDGTTNDFTVDKKTSETSVTAKDYYAAFKYVYTNDGNKNSQKDVTLVAKFTIKEDFSATIEPSIILISKLGTTKITMKRNKFLYVLSDKNK